jgi:ABC-type hemin transport system substrate-binding protein
MSRQVNIDGIENKINTLGQIEKWDEKLNMIKQIKADIKKENENINNLILSLDKPLTPYIFIKKLIISKKLSL